MKYGSLLVAVAILTLSMGVAQASDQIRVISVDSASLRQDRPQRPEMQTRDGDYSFCDDSDGLVCGDYTCGEFEGLGGVGDSYCAIGISQTTSDP